MSPKSKFSSKKAPNPLKKKKRADKELVPKPPAPPGFLDVRLEARTREELPGAAAGAQAPKAAAPPADPAGSPTEEARQAAPQMSRSSRVYRRRSSFCCCLEGMLALLRPWRKTEPYVEADGLPSLLENLYPKESLAPIVRPMQPLSEILAQGEDQAKPASAAKADAPRPSFAGRWVQTRVVGNMDQLMMEGGLSWPIRQMAKRLGYGVGKTFFTISQDADAISMVQEVPTKKPFATAFVVGEPGWQETRGPDGKSLVRAAWDGPVLVMESKSPAGRVFPSTRRWVDPETGELVICSRTSRGEEVLRVFARR